MVAGMPMAMNSCMGANEKLVCGLIGAKGMGNADLHAFLRQKNTECAAICDVTKMYLLNVLLKLRKYKDINLRDLMTIEDY